MFKYISGILGTISPGQRLVALSILLLSITLIAIGPKIVNSFTHDTEELNNKINLQKSEINDLTVRIKELSKQVIDNERECTNSLVAKERELLTAISEIENEFRKSEIKTNTSHYRMINDSNSNARVVTPQPNNHRKMVKMISSLKLKVKKDIESKN
jgi:Na+/phosphate symporter